MPKTRRKSVAACITASMLLEAGDWLLNVHLQRIEPAPTPQQIAKLVRQPKLLAEAARQAFTLSPTATYEPLPVATNPYPRTRECLAIIDEAVRAAPLSGISVEQVRQLLAGKLQHSISINGLYTMIARHYAIHQLRWFNHHVCLRADITIVALARNLREKRAREAVMLHQPAPRVKLVKVA